MLDWLLYETQKHCSIVVHFIKTALLEILADRHWMANDLSYDNK